MLAVCVVQRTSCTKCEVVQVVCTTDAAPIYIERMRICIAEHMALGAAFDLFLISYPALLTTYTPIDLTLIASACIKSKYKIILTILRPDVIINVTTKLYCQYRPLHRDHPLQTAPMNFNERYISDAICYQ